MPAKSPQPQATITLRELNRATLTRQMLLQREAIGVVDAVERLGALQAQYSPSPYVALWSRLVDFQRDELTQALHDRTVVKASLIRWTLHIVSARDYPYFTVLPIDVRWATWRSSTESEGVDVAGVHRRLLDFASAPRLQDEMANFLLTQVPLTDPEMSPRMLWHAIAGLGWLVHTPPSGTWKYFGKNPYLAARQWLGEMPEPTVEEAVTYVVRRYLAAYGPATRADVLQWSGLPVVSYVDTALERLGDEVMAFREEGGKKTLYDLRDAPRPPAETAAPVRFLAKWDNVLLAADERRRVLPEEYRRIVIRKNGDVLPTILVDGVVAGVWDVTVKRGTATLTIEPYEPVPPATRTELVEEGDRLVRWYEPEAKAFEVIFTD